MTSLTSKVALITAGSAGLGAAIARLLAVDYGMSIVINYSNNEQRASSLLQQLQEAVKSSTSRQSQEADMPAQKFHAIRADLSVKTEVQKLAEEALRRVQESGTETTTSS